VLSVIEKGVELAVCPGQDTVTSNSCSVTASAVVLPIVDPAPRLVFPSVDPGVLELPGVEAEVPDRPVPPPSVVPEVLVTAAVVAVVAS